MSIFDDEDELKDQLAKGLAIVKVAIPHVAEIYKLLYDELKKQGFNEEQTMAIVANYKFSDK